MPSGLFWGEPAFLYSDDGNTGLVGLSAASADKPRSLISMHQRREGDIITSLPCLWMDDRSKLQTFLNTHETFWGSVVHIRNVASRDRTLISVWAVLLGLGLHLQHYSLFRKSPNARLAFDPKEGFNKGALTLITDTKNMSGIRAQSVVVINKGVDIAGAEQREPSGTPSKKFKGALEILWQKSEVALDDEGGVDAQLKKGREEKAKLDAMAVTKANAEAAKKAAQEAVKKKKEEDSEAKKRRP